MARNSRPPGFDMTYQPARVTFGPPFIVRLPATLYLGFAVLLSLAVAVAPHFPSDSWLYREVVFGDQTRVVTSAALSVFLLVSSAASVLRQQMAGVIVHPDGIETREVVSFGLPRIKRLAWAQIDRVAIPMARAPGDARPFSDTPFSDTAPRLEAAGKITKIRLDLWNGRHEFLPDVAKLGELALTIERVALARAIPIEGGTGLLDDLESPFVD